MLFELFGKEQDLNYIVLPVSHEEAIGPSMFCIASLLRPFSKGSVMERTNIWLYDSSLCGSYVYGLFFHTFYPYDLRGLAVTS